MFVFKRVIAIFIFMFLITVFMNHNFLGQKMSRPFAVLVHLLILSVFTPSVFPDYMSCSNCDGLNRIGNLDNSSHNTFVCLQLVPMFQEPHSVQDWYCAFAL